MHLDIICVSKSPGHFESKGCVPLWQQEVWCGRWARQPWPSFGGSNCVWRLGTRYMLCEKKILCPVSPNCLADVGRIGDSFLSPAAVVMMDTARTFSAVHLLLFNLYWLKCFLLEMPVRVKAMVFLSSLALILVQDTMMKITLALIYSPHEFNDALIACTCLSFSLDGQRRYVDSFLRFALNSSFIILNNVLRLIIRRSHRIKDPSPSCDMRNWF